MDRRLKLAYLVRARQHVAAGEEHIARQTELVAELERDKHDASEARRLLAKFIVMQSLHIDGLERLEAELLDKDAGAMGRPGADGSVEALPCPYVVKPT